MGLDISRSIGRAVRSKVALPANLMGQYGHPAVNGALLGGGIAGLTAQGLNMMTGNPDGSDDINVMAAMGMGAGIGAMGRSAREFLQRKNTSAGQSLDAQMGNLANNLAPIPFDTGVRGPTDSPFSFKEAAPTAKVGRMTSGYGIEENLGNDSPLALPGAVASPLIANARQAEIAPAGVPAPIPVTPAVTTGQSKTVVPTGASVDKVLQVLNNPGNVATPFELPSGKVVAGVGGKPKRFDSKEDRDAYMIEKNRQGKTTRREKSQQEVDMEKLGESQPSLQEQLNLLI